MQLGSGFRRSSGSGFSFLAGSGFNEYPKHWFWILLITVSAACETQHCGDVESQHPLLATQDQCDVTIVSPAILRLRGYGTVGLETVLHCLHGRIQRVTTLVLEVYYLQVYIPYLIVQLWFTQLLTENCGISTFFDLSIFSSTDLLYSRYFS